MDFIEGAAYGMSAAFVLIYVDFTLTGLAWPTAQVLSAFTGAA